MEVLDPSAREGRAPSRSSGRLHKPSPLVDTVVRLGVPYAALLVTGGALVRASLQPLSNADTWFHLRAGEEILHGWHLADPQPWTPFENAAGWTLTQWLPEVVAASFNRAFGLSGVMWLLLLGTLSLTIGVYRGCRAGAAPLAAALVTALTIIAMGPTLSPRPQLVSFVLLAVFTNTWLRTMEDLRPRWWLVPLTWVWACSHGMWFTGVLLGFGVVAGLALEPAGRQHVRRLALVPLLGVVAAAVTPIGPRLLLSPLQVGGVTRFITEWEAPSFRDVSPLVAILMIGIVAVVWLRRGSMPWPQVVVLALATGWVLLSKRTVTLGAVMAAPILAAVVQSWLPHPVLRSSRRELALLLSGAAACLGVAALLLSLAPTRPGKVPVALDAQLGRLPAGSVVLDDSALGGWLEWRHPQLAPVIDGRFDAYTPAYIERYGVLMRVSGGWRSVVKDTGASVALVKQRSPLATALQGRLHWSVVGTDEGYVLLRSSATG